MFLHYSDIQIESVIYIVSALILKLFPKLSYIFFATRLIVFVAISRPCLNKASYRIVIRCALHFLNNKTHTVDQIESI